MEQGPSEKKIIEQCMRERIELPARIQNAPSLMLGLDLYYDAFMNLMADRSTGFSIGPIVWSTVQRYIEANELSEDQAGDMHYHIREMDGAYLKYVAKKSGK